VPVRQRKAGRSEAMAQAASAKCACARHMFVGLIMVEASAEGQVAAARHARRRACAQCSGAAQPKSMFGTMAALQSLTPVKQ